MVLTSSFQFQDFQHYVDVNTNQTKAFTYTRGANPTLEIFEQKIAKLENGECAKSFASGKAAISAAILGLIEQSQHILYGSASKFIRHLQRFGVESTIFHVSETADIFQHVQDNTKIIYFESPSSQKFEMLDLEMISLFSKKKNIYTIMDNTWATPLFQNPLCFGIDVVIHSCSKYIGGHSDIVGGILVTNFDTMQKIEELGCNLLGETMSPVNAWLAIRGLRTLPVRLEKQEESIKEIIDFLKNDSRISKIYHPMISTPKDICQKYLRGYTSLFGFVLKEADVDIIQKFIDALQYFTLA